MAFWIQDIQHELGITVLMVEHDMTLVSKVSDRVLAMNQGEVLAMGTPREVQSHPRRDRGLSRHGRRREQLAEGGMMSKQKRCPARNTPVIPANAVTPGAGGDEGTPSTGSPACAGMTDGGALHEPQSSGRERHCPSSSSSTSKAPTARSRPSAASACRCARGEIATVLGSNGAGKTTILKTISGIIDPRKGSIEFKGAEHHGAGPGATSSSRA